MTIFLTLLRALLGNLEKYFIKLLSFLSSTISITFEVSVTSTDAVNGRQLYNAMQNSGTVGIQDLRKEVRNAKDEMNRLARENNQLKAQVNSQNERI